MEKADSSREVPKWETLNRDILSIIFGKLHVMDLTMGASRVCISWFLASHNITLWNTVDLYTPQKVEESLNLRNILSTIIKLFPNLFEVNRNLRKITGLSRTTPKNLLFRFHSYVLEDDLMLAAERMPNIEKIVLPVWMYLSKKTCQFSFSQWKNLKTLIIAYNHIRHIRAFKFQAVGENCSNLTNLKYLGNMKKSDAKEMVYHLQSLKRLSLRCSYVSTSEVLLLITRLKNLRILNLSHCIGLDWDPLDWDPPDMVTNEDLVQAAAQKLDKFIVCSQNDCAVCKDQLDFSWSYAYKHWRNDEIKELEF